MTAFILKLIADAGYLGIALLMCLENVIPPIPSEAIMGFGGIAAAHGRFDFWLLVAMGTLGTVAGNFFWYEIGRRLGYERLKPLVDRYGRWATMEWEDVEWLHRFFRKHGAWAVFVFRFLPTFRTMISLPAGMLRMPLGWFLVATAAGSAVWNTILAAAGFLLGTHFEALQRYVGPFAVATSVLAALWYVWRMATWKPRAQR